MDAILRREYGPDGYRWSNREYESGLPFDFVLRDGTCVEVKTTAMRRGREGKGREGREGREGAAMLAVSWAELVLANDKRESYEIWHVALTRGKRPVVRRLRNPSKFFGKGIGLFIKWG